MTTINRNHRLATAEAVASALDYSFVWINDRDHMREKGEYQKTCESCLMYDKAGRLVQSLGCVDDASPEYRRLVQAELASQELDSMLQ